MASPHSAVPELLVISRRPKPRAQFIPDLVLKPTRSPTNNLPASGPPSLSYKSEPASTSYSRKPLHACWGPPTRSRWSSCSAPRATDPTGPGLWGPTFETALSHSKPPGALSLELQGRKQNTEQTPRNFDRGKDESRFLSSFGRLWTVVSSGELPARPAPPRPQPCVRCRVRSRAPGPHRCPTSLRRPRRACGVSAGARRSGPQAAPQLAAALRPGEGSAPRLSLRGAAPPRPPRYPRPRAPRQRPGSQKPPGWRGPRGRQPHSEPHSRKCERRG